jgi:Cft2 family RNA processing exonuclease
MTDRVTMTSYGGGNNIGGSSYGYSFPMPNRRPFFVQVDAGACHVPFAPENRAKILPEYAERVPYVDAFLITHSHFDHMGMLPWFTARHPDAKVYITSPTLEFSRIGWNESMGRMNKSNWTTEDRFFTENDVKDTLARVHIIRSFSRIHLTDELTVYIVPPQHILGAVSFIFDYHGRLYYHTGDISFNQDSLIAQVPSLEIRGSSWGGLIPDGTYSGEYHSDIDEENARLRELVDRTRLRGGILVCPVLKQYKAQALWHKLVTQVGVSVDQIWFDGRLQEAFEIYARYTSMSMPPMSQFMKGRSDRYDFFESEGFRVVLASGGMVPYGSPAYHAMRLGIEDPNNTILITSYTDPCSPIHDVFSAVRDGGNRVVVLGNDEYEVQAEVHRVACLHSHADEAGIEPLRNRIRDGRTVLVHGDNERLTKYAKTLNDPDVLVGTNGTEVELS